MIARCVFAQVKNANLSQTVVAKCLSAPRNESARPRERVRNRGDAVASAAAAAAAGAHALVSPAILNSRQRTRKQPKLSRQLPRIGS